MEGMRPHEGGRAGRRVLAASEPVGEVVARISIAVPISDSSPEEEGGRASEGADGRLEPDAVVDEVPAHPGDEAVPDASATYGAPVDGMTAADAIGEVTDAEDEVTDVSVHEAIDENFGEVTDTDEDTDADVGVHEAIDENFGEVTDTDEDTDAHLVELADQEPDEVADAEPEGEIGGEAPGDVVDAGAGPVNASVVEAGDSTSIEAEPVAAEPGPPAMGDRGEAVHDTEPPAPEVPEQEAAHVDSLAEAAGSIDSEVGAAGPEPEPVAMSGTDVALEPEPVADREAGPEPLAAPQPEPVATSEPEPEPLAEPEPEPEPLAAPQPEPEPADEDDQELFGDDYEELVRVAETTFDAVDRALARLGDGTYGTCETCGGPIGDDLLEVAPTATTCERHLRPV